VEQLGGVDLDPSRRSLASPNQSTWGAAITLKILRGRRIGAAADEPMVPGEEGKGRRELKSTT